jgi:glyoxylase I family protein
MLRVLHHVCIATDRYPDSVRFYRDVLGFSIVKETRNFHGREYNTWLKNVDILIELQTPKRGSGWWGLHRGSRRGGIDHICFLVDDITREVDRILAAGHTAFKEKDDAIIYCVEGVSLCKIVAPEGTVIELREQDICF